MPETRQWTCPTCGVTLETPFCARCGEEPLTPRDLTLRGVGEKLLHALTSVDARAARSAWKLLRHPGDLTLAWTRGVRQRYVAPFQLFLIANVLFFALQWMTSENVFSSSLASHLHHQDWSDLAQSQVARRLAATHMSIEQYAPVFDRAVVINAKSLILLMTSPMVDNVLSVANLAACKVYIYLALGPVYGVSGMLRTTKAILLAFAVAVIVLGYRFVLFFITLYAT